MKVVALMSLLAVGCAREVQEAPLSLEAFDGVLGTSEFVVPASIALRGEPDPKLVESDLLLATDYAARHSGSRAVSERALLTRALFETLRVETEKIPFSALEVEAARERHWLELARPASLRFLSAFVKVGELAPEEQAFDLATQIVEVTRNDLSPGDFAAHIGGLENESIALDVRCPLARDGRAVFAAPGDEGLAQLPLEVLSSYPKLESVGSISGVIAARDGFYVLYTLEVIPEAKKSDEEARSTIEAAILEERLKEPVRKLRAELRTANPPKQNPRANELLPLAWKSR